MSNPGEHNHHEGLAHDLSMLVGRRRALSLLGGAGLVALAACAPENARTAVESPAPTGAASRSEVETGGGAGEIPEETNGPFPADGVAQGYRATLRVPI